VLLTFNRSILACLAMLIGMVGSVKAAAPVITCPTNVDIYFVVQNPTDGQFGLRLANSDGATKFEATGLPPASFLNTATGWINGSRSTPGRFDVSVRATNSEGTDSELIHLNIHPATIGVKSFEGIYHAGQKFSITLRYNAPMIVTGTPALALVLGPAGAVVFKDAKYVSGSGTNELVFQYAVAADDTAPNGVQLLPRAPAGGLIADTTGLAASPTLPLRHFASGITIVPVAGVVAASAGKPIIFANLR
jgi:hypothetical protein